jgi:hypothetical protein
MQLVDEMHNLEMVIQLENSINNPQPIQYSTLHSRFNVE